MNNLKPTGNIFTHLDNNPEVIDTQKIKDHFNTVSKQQSKDALNKLEIWVEKMRKSKKEEIIRENKLKKAAKKNLELERKNKCWKIGQF